MTGDRIQGALVLAPVVALSLGAVYGVPTHTSAAAGWILLCALPALAWSALHLHQQRVAAIRAFLLVWFLGWAGWAGFIPLGETFEARRAIITLTGWLVLLLSGAGLGSAGRQFVTRGAVLASLGGLIFAWLDTGHHDVRAFAGTFENSGDLSETLLPGALLGYAALVSERGIWRILGGATATLFLGTVGFVPVYAGGLSFLAAATTAAALTRRARHLAGMVALSVVFGVALLAGRATDQSSYAPTSAAEEAPAQDPSKTLGGVTFRRLTWARVPAMVVGERYVPLGVGAGQFSRVFPPYRDPNEIELSTLGRRAPTTTEVEHPHNDWLLAFAEYGLVGGIAWLVFGLTVLRSAWRALRVGAESRAEAHIGSPLDQAIGIAAIGVLVNACFNSPFFEGPAFAISAPLLGALLSRPRSIPIAHWMAAYRPRLIKALQDWVARYIPKPWWLRVAVLAVALAYAPSAFAFVRHGSALAALSGSAQTLAAGQVSHAAVLKRESLEEALAACPDSLVAQTELAHLARVESAPPEEQLAMWRRILDQRPHRFEALMSSANLLARLERFEEASEHFARAARIDPADPNLTRNRLLLALRAGDVETMLGLLADRNVAGALDASWLEKSAAELLLSGRPHLGLPLLTRARPELEVQTAEAAYALSSQLDTQLLGDAMLFHAHFTWAREHALRDDPASATRSYRQALAVADRYPGLVGGARRVRLELAAALSLRGDRAAAEALATSHSASSVNLAELPDWARAELEKEGWIEP